MMDDMAGGRMARILFAVGTLMLAVGFWQAGSGVYIEAKAWLGQHLIRTAWADTLEGGARQLPWFWADTWPVARLQVPRLDQDLIVLSGANGRTLAWGPGHQDGSALPGRAGATVIAGHRDTHMTFLRDMQSGDEIQMTDRRGVTHRYRAISTQVVHKDLARIVTDDGGHRLVLVTCWPFESLAAGGPFRYVVEAVRVGRSS